MIDIAKIIETNKEYVKQHPELPKAPTNVSGPPYSPMTVNPKRNNRLTIYSFSLYIVVRL